MCKDHGSLDQGASLDSNFFTYLLHLEWYLPKQNISLLFILFLWHLATAKVPLASRFVWNSDLPSKAAVVQTYSSRCFSVLNFINIPCTAFMLVDLESVRIQSNPQYLFTLLGSTCAKAVCRTLMKLTPRRIEPVQKDWSGRTELACEVLCSQFLSHFTASFCANILSPEITKPNCN